MSSRRHDDLCGERMPEWCDCDLIARVRADEATRYEEWLSPDECAAKIAAVEEDGRQLRRALFVAFCDVIDRRETARRVGTP